MMRAIILDCFGVLYVDPASHFYESNVKNYEALRPKIAALSAQCDYGYISQQELQRTVADITGLSVEFIQQNVLRTHQRNQTLVDYTQVLRSTYKVGMLSNIGANAMDDFFSAEERKTLFDATVLSGEVGMAKPHPAIFELMAKKLDVLPGQCVMIDDVEDNCSGADAAGMKAVLYTSNAQLRRDLDSLL